MCLPIFIWFNFDCLKNGRIPVGQQCCTIFPFFNYINYIGNMQVMSTMLFVCRRGFIVPWYFISMFDLYFLQRYKTLMYVCFSNSSKKVKICSLRNYWVYIYHNDLRDINVCWNLKQKTNEGNMIHGDKFVILCFLTQFLNVHWMYLTKS